MNKFFNTLALCLAVLAGASWLWATPYPQGVGGVHPVVLSGADVTGTLPHASTSNDSANVHGLDSGAFVVGNLDAAGEFIQRNNTDNVTVGSIDKPIFQGSTNITFGTAFSATPFLVVGGATTSVSNHSAGANNVSNTGFALTVHATTASTNNQNVGWIALGT